MLKSLNGGSDGGKPRGGVTEGSDGALYGTASSVEANALGTVFKLNKDGTGFAVLRSLIGGSDGIIPNGLTEGSDGALYGTAFSGGAYALGTVFKLNKDGTAFEVLQALGGTAGAPRKSFSKVIFGSDGRLYATSLIGGDANRGTVFALEIACDTPVATITGPASGSVYAVGAPVTFTGTFTGANGPHTAIWTIGGTTVAGVVDEALHTVTATVTFAGAGVYPVQLTVANDCGNSGSAETVGDLAAMVVIYDPSAGFVTGCGWINSPAGAANWVGGENLTGKASFGFVSRYLKGATVPTGNTEFQFKAGGLNFKSTSYEWLVVAGARAQYKGAGTINGVAGYGFLLTAIDGQVSGGGGADKFRIKIWNGDGVIYDNQLGADDSATPSTTLSGGSIVIHK